MQMFIRVSTATVHPMAKSGDQQPLLPSTVRSWTSSRVAAVSAAALALLVLLGLAMQSQQLPSTLVGDRTQGGFPRWAKNRAGMFQMDTTTEDNSLWRQDTQAPFIPHTNMYAGKGADLEGSAENVRLILGIAKSFRGQGWDGNNFIKNFDDAKLEFLYRAHDTCLVLPPLDIGDPIYVSGRAAALFTQFIQNGHNSIIVAGGFQNIQFINDNIATGSGSAYSLESMADAGPFELQNSVTGSIWEQSPMALPCDDSVCVGVTISSLPRNAVVLYASHNVASVFALPIEAGALIYIGFDFDGKIGDIPPAWAAVLQMAQKYVTTWAPGKNPIHAAPVQAKSFPNAVTMPETRDS
jgi:hypothetical protein